MTQYFSQTDAKKNIIHDNSTSAASVTDNNNIGYKFNLEPITFNDLSQEETISKEDRIKVYKKVFETKKR